MSGQARPIGFGAALVEQLRWFWHRQWLWIVIVTLLTAGGCALIITSLPEEARALVFVIFGSAIHQILVLIALSWALSAWRDDPPKDRQYFWLHPVERTSHTIARTLAGFIWLMLVLAIVIGVVLGIAVALQGDSAELGTPRFWAYVAGGVALAYIAASIAPILSDRPGIWMLFIVALVIIVGAIAEMRDIVWLRNGIEQVFRGGPFSFGSALGAPGQEAAQVLSSNLPPGEAAELPPGITRALDARPGTALLIWLPVSVVAFLGAAHLSRPR